MCKQVLIIIFMAVMLFFINGFSKAADVSEFFRASLSIFRIVQASGGNLTTTVDCDTGNLLAALTPTFRITTNQFFFSSDWTMSATVQDNAASTINAMYGTSANPSIVLANTVNPPNSSAINDIKSGVLTSNANAIAYPMSTTLDEVSGSLNITVNQYDDVNHWYDIRSQSFGTKILRLNIGTAVRANTYTAMDSPGSYEAIVTFRFGTP